MSKVSFYTHISQPEAFIEQLLLKLHRMGKKVLLWTAHQADCQFYDKYLWEHTPSEFLPHEILPNLQTFPSDTPIVLSFGEQLPNLPSDIVILNLSQQTWHNITPQPERVLELVGKQEPELAAARERFKSYREHGFEIEHFNMSARF